MRQKSGCIGFYFARFSQLAMQNVGLKNWSQFELTQHTVGFRAVNFVVILEHGSRKTADSDGAIDSNEK